MNVEFLTDPAAVTSRLVGLLEKCTRASWAVAWATDSSAVFKAAVAHKGKFKHLIFGTNRWITSPDAIQQMRSIEGFRVLEPERTQLFHPKLYVFRVGEESFALIGSHNLTRNAFTENDEACVLLRASAEDPEMQKLWSYISHHFNSANARQPDDAWMFNYRVKREIQKAANLVAAAAVDASVIAKPSISTDGAPSAFLLSWDAFAQRVIEEKNRTNGTHTIEGRLAVLERCGALLASKPTFADLDPEDRRRVAGTASGTKAVRMGEPDWAWFGNMAPWHKFRHEVKEDPWEISAALEHIPASGRVEEHHYQAFLRTYQSAKDAIGSCSRLMAMKRPDELVCICDGNMKGIVEHFGLTEGITTKNYWTLIKLIRQTPWWQAGEPPDELGRRIHAGRAALLDSLYYTPKGRYAKS